MKLKESKYSILVNLICLMLLFGVTIYLGMSWNHLPDRIPAHYNAMGEVDRWGGKGELLLLPILAWVMYIGITVLERRPHLWNTGVTITAENQARIYRILKKMIVTMKFLVVLVFVFLTINSASAKALPVWFLPVFLVALFGLMILFIIRLIQEK